MYGGGAAIISHQLKVNVSFDDGEAAFLLPVRRGNEGAWNGDKSFVANFHGSYPLFFCCKKKWVSRPDEQYIKQNMVVSFALKRLNI